MVIKIKFRISLVARVAKVPEKKKQKPIAKVAKKRKEVNKKYSVIVKEMLAESDRCEIQSPECTGKAQGLNHKQKRSPGNIIRKENLERACNACNGFCERNPKWAIENGHQISRFKKF